MTDPEELLAGPAFGHHPWSVQELVHDIHSGQVRLPDLQRPFVWSNAKVRDLIDSMYRGYPVGELMFWANRDEDHTRPVGGDTKTQDATMQVIDGQQRLTSLYAVVKGLAVWRDDYTRERIRIAFNPLTERFEVTTPLFERSAEWIPDIVTVFTSPIAARSAYLRRLTSDDREVNLEMATSIELALNRLHQLQNYMFQVVQVKESIGREEVAEIFVRINSEGVTLSSGFHPYLDERVLGGGTHPARGLRPGLAVHASGNLPDHRKQGDLDATKSLYVLEPGAACACRRRIRTTSRAPARRVQPTPRA